MGQDIAQHLTLWNIIVALENSFLSTELGSGYLIDVGFGRRQSGSSLNFDSVWFLVQGGLEPYISKR